MPNFEDLYAGGCTGIVTTGSGSTLPNSLVARGSRAVFYGADGWYNRAATVYICVFDATAVPSNATLTLSNMPKHVFQVTGPGNFSINVTPSGELFLNGIVIAVSTTALPTFTADTNNAGWFNVQSVLEGPGAT